MNRCESISASTLINWIKYPKSLLFVGWLLQVSKTTRSAATTRHLACTDGIQFQESHFYLLILKLLLASRQQAWNPIRASDGPMLLPTWRWLKIHATQQWMGASRKVSRVWLIMWLFVCVWSCRVNSMSAAQITSEANEAPLSGSFCVLAWIDLLMSRLVVETASTRKTDMALTWWHRIVR